MPINSCPSSPPVGNIYNHIVNCQQPGRDTKNIVDNACRGSCKNHAGSAKNDFMSASGRKKERSTLARGMVWMSSGARCHRAYADGSLPNSSTSCNCWPTAILKSELCSPSTTKSCDSICNLKFLIYLVTSTYVKYITNGFELLIVIDDDWRFCCSNKLTNATAWRNQLNL